MEGGGGDGLLGDPERVRIGLRRGDGGEGRVGIVDATRLGHGAEKGDGVVHRGPSGLGGHPLVD